MRRSTLRLYGPFLALALVQALFIVAAPSKPAGQRVATAPGAQGRTAAGTAAGTAGAATAFDAQGNPIGPGGVGGGGEGGGGGGGGAVGAGATGDISHCVGANKEYQFDIFINHGPPCVAKWPAGADNGGATYQGVTADSVKIIIFSSKPNEQVNAILGAKGLATSAEDEAAFYEAAFAFIQENYEFYGRRLDIERVEGDCPTTPPDYDACFAAAQTVLEKRPFMVVWGTPLYADVMEVWARSGIVTVGGWHFDDQYFVKPEIRGLRYDVFMDGTQSADFIAEYYCKKMARQPADRAGTLIHPRIGGRTTTRHLGIVVPEIPANRATADRVAAAVGQCEGRSIPVFTYESNIETAVQQTQATVSGLIDAGVTTMVCMCDPIAPVFSTKGMTANQYYPEILLPGMGLLDYDLLGQLYDPQQMIHAFGPSHLQKLSPLDETDAARMWRAQGNAGHPCGNNGCGIQWAYMSFVATAIQMAGPFLSPQSLEQGILSLPPSGVGNPYSPLVKFGPGDYTALSDVKEVYWDPNATSPTDGSQGAFVPVADGRRYQLGEFPANGLAGIPVADR